MIATRQNMVLRPQLAKLDAILLPSLGVPADVHWRFSPLDVVDEETRSKIDKANAETAQIYANSGLVPTPALEKGVQSRLIEDGTYPGLKEALAELPDMDPGDDDDLLTAEERAAKGGDPESAGKGGSIGSAPPRRAANDAKPRTLYVHRKLLNAAEFIRWAKSQGFESTLPADDLHVTVLYSKAPVDWMKMGEDFAGELIVSAGGARIVEPLGDKGAVVLLFNSSSLAWRHEEMVRNGASHDFAEYQPHVTISYAGGDVDLSKVEPFRGELRFGPEEFEELDEEWANKIEEA
jgi:hypothetical protein